MSAYAHAPAAAPPRRQRRQARPRVSFGVRLLGFIGELLITAGLLLGLYVVWNLYYTDVTALREQAVVSEELDRSFVPSPERAGTPSDEEPPVVGPFTEGDVFAHLWVPRWDGGEPYRRTIAEGTDRSTVLDRLGIGHYVDTAMPGQVGNFALAGHRQSHGRPFYDVETLEIGDPLIVEAEVGWFVYRVTDTTIVTPDQVEVVAPNPYEPEAQATQRLITLTTCHPLFSIRERFIVHGEMEHWIPRESGRPAAIIDAEAS